MIFIDKSLKEAEGRGVNERFIRDCYDPDTGEFYPALSGRQLYEEYKKRKAEWLPLLREEQSDVCAYCRRDVVGRGKTNIEHIIPRSLKYGVGDADCSGQGEREYRRYVRIAPALGSVVLSDKYELDVAGNVDNIGSNRAMPHTIAHGNLLLTCNGIRGNDYEGCCCNNNRKDDYLSPILLVAEADGWISYDRLGYMRVSTGEADEDRSWDGILSELNGESYLEMRYLWRCIAVNTDLTEDYFGREMTLQEKASIIRTALIGEYVWKDEMLRKRYLRYAAPQSDEGKAGDNELLWNRLLRYIWFLRYYSNSAE